MAVGVSFSRGYQESLISLEGIEIKRITKAVNQFLDDQDHPSLNFEALKGKHQHRLYTIRGSKELRVLMAREGDTLVLLHAGHHDDVYDLAERKFFLAGNQSGHIGLFDLGQGDVDAGAQAQQQEHVVVPADERPGVVDHWTDAELSGIGFTPAQIQALRDLKDPNNLLAKVPSVDEDQLEAFFRAMEYSPEEFHNEEPDQNQLQRAIARFGGLGDLTQLYSVQEFEELASRPIEAWMVFLHPEQRTLVQKSFSGPARVRGSAGTGKTVVALHRAAHLASLNQAAGEKRPVLFTTYIRSLPPVFERLYLRLPNSEAGAVEFLHIDKVARDVCYRSNDRVITAPREINRAFSAAFKTVVRPGSPLAKTHLSREYVRDEVVAVVKGRGIRSLDEYLEIQRTGRMAPLGRDQRRQIWELREAWDAEMANRGTIDFPDVITRARDHARRSTEPSYSAAIIDEAQDLTLVALQLVRGLVNAQGPDRPNALLLCGDGAQRIYPGGYTLRQAGVEVRGRTTVLRVNYRNTTEIIGAAMAVAGNEEVDDLGDVFQRGDAPADARRDGLAPKLVTCPDLDGQLDEIANTVRARSQADGIGPGDTAVLVPTNRLAKTILSGLRDRGLKSVDLEKYDGRSTDEVKVGTYHRGKGLEFKVVFLPALDNESFPPKAGGEAESAERASLAVSQLFVAMTRARDELIILYSGEVADVIEQADLAFELKDGGS